MDDWKRGGVCYIRPDVNKFSIRKGARLRNLSQQPAWGGLTKRRGNIDLEDANCKRGGSIF